MSFDVRYQFAGAIEWSSESGVPLTESDRESDVFAYRIAR